MKETKIVKHKLISNRSIGLGQKGDVFVNSTPNKKYILKKYKKLEILTFYPKLILQTTKNE